MNKVRTRLSALALTLLAMAACTSETEGGIPDNPSMETGNGDNETRREVVMTLKNTLNINSPGTKATTKAPIATEEENHLSLLYVYVFGSTTEDGEYTFQEQLVYFDPILGTPPPLAGIDGLTLLDLNPGADKNQYNAVLRIKKGLFVKLYVVANNSYLGDSGQNLGTAEPFYGAEKYMDFADYKPLVLAKNGTTINTDGIPTEKQFVAFHTFLDTKGHEADGTGYSFNNPFFIMSGANTVPLDLTDYSASGRLQTGLKLTRTIARFDITNNAAVSKFTINDVSIANAHRGATCFPIKGYGNDLDIVPGRGKFNEKDLDGHDNDFYDPKANTGTVVGAVYCPPSPIADGGYLILEGTYQANLTDPAKNVIYKVPFIQDNGKGGSTSLEINANHRYTIAITKADDYHVDFDITVADWTDADDINGFEPVEPIPPIYTLDITQAITTAYKNALDNTTPTPLTLTEFPPFNYDGASLTGPANDLNGTSADPLINATYTIEVSQEENFSEYDQVKAIDYCKNMDGNGWRLPTMIELFAMWDKCRDGGTDATTSDALGMKFSPTYYWSGSVYNNDIDQRCKLNFRDGVMHETPMVGYNSIIRCVREK